jgi:toxin ParE1/3/4
MAYSIVLEPLSLQDIQQGIDYYDDQQIGLGEKFEAAVNKHLISLGKNPFFQVRYDNVHCLPVKKYPYMIHFTINESDKTVTVRAVFHTSLDPEKWTNRK